MRTLAAVDAGLGAKLILGMNLAADEPALGAAEARAYVKALGGTSAIEALEIGNEPNLYSGVTAFPGLDGKPVAARPKGFGFPSSPSSSTRSPRRCRGRPWRAPALSAGWSRGHRSGPTRCPTSSVSDPRLSAMTVHRYPLVGCSRSPASRSTRRSGI